ncbi:hypothetical protein [Krasilnikovia sp. MM14-A1004]|uniref:hypothetical protein n=1 Tax=Krasilnikovia sp. MM14-A1004 TaxID=3373541 RepID=UPI00399CD430
MSQPVVQSDPLAWVPADLEPRLAATGWGAAWRDHLVAYLDGQWGAGWQQEPAEHKVAWLTDLLNDAAADAPAQAAEEPEVPTAAVQALADEAMGAATQLMQDVAHELDSGTYVYGADGLQLLRASATLHLRTEAVGSLIVDHGIQAVAEAFRQVFGRPIIEQEQLQAYANWSDDVWGTFHAWATMLWTLIESDATLTGNVPRLTSVVFDHEKGYNRAINFTNTPVASDLNAVVQAAEPPGHSDEERGLWIFERLRLAQLIQGDGTDTWDSFRQVAEQNWAVLSSRLGNGLSLDDALSDAVRTDLEGLSLLG